LSFNTAGFIGYVHYNVENHQFKSAIELYSTVFAYNIVTEAFWRVKSVADKTTIVPYVSFSNSAFMSNIGFNIELQFIGNLTLIKDNKFYNNLMNYAGKTLLEFNGTIPTFEGYNNFTFNTADIIMSINNYIFIKEYAIINISYNEALSDALKDHKQPKTLIYSEKKDNIQPCLFQFLSTKHHLDEEFQNNERDVFSVIFKNNTNYNSMTFGIQLNSCYWVKKSLIIALTPGTVYKKVLQYDITDKNIVSRQVGTLCHCENETDADCLSDNVSSTTYPGQAIPISLK